MTQYFSESATGTLDAFHGLVLHGRQVNVGLLEHLQPLPDAFDAGSAITWRKWDRYGTVWVERTEPTALAHARSRRERQDHCAAFAEFSVGFGDFR